MSDASTRPLSHELLNAEIEGRNLEGGRLGDHLGEGPTLVVFLRHFG